MNWIDIGIIIVVGSSIYCGYKKGFFVTAIELVKWVASMVLARLFYKPFTAFVTTHLFDPSERISGHVRTYLYDFFQYDPLTGQSMTGGEVAAALDQLPLPNAFAEGLKNTLGQQMVSGTIEFVDVLTQRVTELILYGIGFLLLFALLIALFGVLQWLGVFLSKLPLLKELNQGGGLIMGAIIGVLMVYFFMTVVNFFPTFEWRNNVVEAIESSQIGIYFYKYNLLQYAFKSVLVQGKIL